RGMIATLMICIIDQVRLPKEILLHGIYIVDRLLSCHPSINNDRMELMGLTALWLAVKFEYRNAPSAESMVSVLHSGYSATELIESERFACNALEYRLVYPSPASFLREYLIATCWGDDIHTLAWCLIHVSCFENGFVGAKPSLVAAAALMFTRQVFLLDEWTSKHSEVTGYTAEELRSLVGLYKAVIASSNGHRPFEEPFGSPKY
ncbi:cyclin-like protein, partial [Piedraia hortae CBS 480.64]